MTIDELKNKLKSITEDIFMLGDQFVYLNIYQIDPPVKLKERHEKLLQESRCLRLAIALRECVLQSDICKNQGLGNLEFLVLHEMAISRGYING
ncbi:MAG: hypothetical protein ACRDBQ_18210 [Shewanella sp.]